MWTGENGGFRKRLRHWHWHVPVKKAKRMFSDFDVWEINWLNFGGYYNCPVHTEQLDDKLQTDDFNVSDVKCV